MAVLSVSAQDSSLYKRRQWLVGGISVAGYGGSLAVLSQAWYKNYPRSSFHTFNDIGEWQQMDKIGHAWTAYNTSRVTTALWRWSGLPRKESVLLGAGSSLLYMLSIEYLDGRSAEWGWSWPDAGADMGGAVLFAAQELGWKEQRIELKFSSHQRHYSDPQLRARADDLFGKSFPERLLKDYNAQTYWLSFNIRSLANSNWPAWLNIAVGYGADGMFGGYDNIARDKDGNVSFNRQDIPRYRQWYLSPDIDLTRIKTRSRIWRTVFSAFNVLKLPAPALMIGNGRLRLKALAF